LLKPAPPVPGNRVPPDHPLPAIIDSASRASSPDQ